MRERDTVWILLEAKERPGVVIEVKPDLVRVAYGTSESHNWPRVEVSPDTRQGRAFGLVEPTHFYGANTAWEVETALRRAVRPCTLEIFWRIRRVVEEYDSTLVPP